MYRKTILVFSVISMVACSLDNNYSEEIVSFKMPDYHYTSACCASYIVVASEAKIKRCAIEKGVTLNVDIAEKHLEICVQNGGRKQSTEDKNYFIGSEFNSLDFNIVPIKEGRYEIGICTSAWWPLCEGQEKQIAKNTTLEFFDKTGKLILRLKYLKE